MIEYDYIAILRSKIIMIKKIVTDWIIPILIAFVIVTLINKFLFFNISVPTGSMYPTITPGDRIAVTRIHDISKIKRGDIIVFRSQELEKTLVKRLIGLPGDKISIKSDGSVYVNDKKINEDYVSSKGTKEGEFKVPDKSYFFMGDNRAESFDSRLWKNPYISEESIMGRARFIFFPLNRIGMLK